MLHMSIAALGVINWKYLIELVYFFATVIHSVMYARVEYMNNMCKDWLISLCNLIPLDSRHQAN